VQGVSTRKVKAITEELCGHGFAASTISAINKGLDVGTFHRFAIGLRKPRRDCGYFLT
jgi:putative transposase